MKGVCQEIHIAQVARRVLYDSQDMHPSAVFFTHTSIDGAVSIMLYFLVVWLGEIFVLLKPLRISVIRTSNPKTAQL